LIEIENIHVKGLCTRITACYNVTRAHGGDCRFYCLIDITVGLQ